MPEPKRLALAGAGGWGRNIARALRKLRGGPLHAVCDPNPATLARLDDLSPDTLRLEDAGRLIRGPAVDALIVATPPETHHSLAAAALRAGKDVLVEKPLALRPEDAADLVRIADGEKRILMVGHLLLYHPAVEKLREVLASGELGEIHYFRSQRVNLGVIRIRENSLGRGGEPVPIGA